MNNNTNNSNSNKKNKAARTIQKGWRSAWLRNSNKPILDAENPRTNVMRDLISLEPIPRKRMVVIDGVAYNVNSLVEMVQKMHPKVPHSRREFENNNFEKIFSRLNNVHRHAKNNSNNNNGIFSQNDIRQHVMNSVAIRHRMPVDLIKREFLEIRKSMKKIFSKTKGKAPVKNTVDGLVKKFSIYENPFLVSDRGEIEVMDSTNNTVQNNSHRYKYVRAQSNSLPGAQYTAFSGVIFSIHGCLLMKQVSLEYSSYLLYNPMMYDIQSASLGIRIHTILPSKPGYPGFKVSFMTSNNAFDRDRITSQYIKDLATFLMVIREAYFKLGSVFERKRKRLSFKAAFDLPRAIKNVIDIVNSV